MNRSADLGQAPRADAAGDGLAARLVGAEARQQAGQVDDAGALVGDDDGARAEDGARRRAARSNVEGRVQQLGGQEAARRAADEDRLERPAAPEPPA